MSNPAPNRIESAEAFALRVRNLVVKHRKWSELQHEVAGHIRARDVARDLALVRAVLEWAADFAHPQAVGLYKADPIRVLEEIGVE